MTHALQQRVHAVGRRARRLVLMHAAAWVTALVVTALLVAGTADYLLRYDDHGVRLIVTLLVLAAAGWSVWRFLLPAWRYRPSDVDTARRIERRFPQLRDRLSSSVAFLNESEDDPRAGSPALRRVVVSETEAQVEPLDLHAALEPRPTRKALLSAMAVVAAAIVVCALDPASAALAARRLAMPWSGESWPLWNNLAFDNPPRRLAKGENFEVELKDQNQRLPDEVQIQYWFEDEDASEIESQPMKPLGEKMLARRENVSRSFRYRAVGGDHQNMPWIELEVVEPPQIASLEILLHPPNYTGWPVEKSGANLRALEGTEVEIRGTTKAPLRAARVVIDAEEDIEIPLALTADHRGFALAASQGGNASARREPAAREHDADRQEATWRITSTGAWRLLLTDETGVTGGSELRHDLQAIPDHPPAVSLEGDDAVSYVTPQALVPLRGLAKDDLAVHTIDLRYLDSAHSDQDYQTIAVFRGPDPFPPQAASDLGGGGQSQRVDFDWDLAKLAGLEPGVQFTYFVAAADYKPQEEKSAARRLVIISERELEDRVGRRHSDILTRLAEVLDKQRAVRSQTTSLEIQLDEAGSLASRDVDHLQSAELNQRQVQQMLSGSPEGVEEQIAELLEDVRNNRMKNADVQRRMNELLGDVQRLARDQLPAVQSALIDALKEARSAQPEAPGDATRSSLKEAGEQQDAAIAALEQMLGELSQWDNYRRVARDLNQLRREQDDLASRTNEMRLNTLGKEGKDLSPQETAALKRLTQQQGEAARRFEQAESRMRQLAAELESTDPLAAETLSDALNAAERSALAGKMRQAASDLNETQLGQAVQQQKESSASLEDLLNVLSNRREHELNRLLEKLQTAADELRDKQQQLKELRKKLEQAASQQDAAEQKRQLEKLSREQQQLAQDVERLARQLQRLQAERASQSAARGAESLSQAGSQSQQGDAGESLESAQQAERDLEDARQELEQAIAQAEQDLFFEQMARLEQAIQGMIKRQKSIVEEVVRLDQLHQAGELSRGQQASVTALAVVERSLADEASQFAEHIAKAKAFEFGLQSAIREMIRTAAHLERGETNEPTQQSARAALDRLERLAEALKTDPSENEQQPGEAGQQPGQSQQPPGDGIAAMAELKLLKLMQEELNHRTALLEAGRQSQGALSAEQEQELNELSQEQGRLAELLLSLGQAAAENPEDNPEQLPGATDAGETDGDLKKSLEESLPEGLK